ncbi:MAG TPA: xanthine dehydrogenase family protein molybdopterin-binding subunit, partial [Chloroflexota bacterium]|nr:xanthine dehydrogenase family protein molybdopterin-binding subunit [Chloroflexota bacterium]
MSDTTLERPVTQAASAHKVVHQPLVRVDAVGKVTGADKFAADYFLPGMLHAKVLRSPHPHARIVRIDASKAESYPGVVCVMTGEDIQDIEHEPTSRVQTVLANKIALFAGQPVVALAATSREIAEEALALIEIEYDPLPAVMDPLEAMEPGAPVIRHEGSEEGVNIDRSEEQIHAAGAGELAEEDEIDEQTNISSQVNFKRGDVEQAFKEADVIVEGRWYSASVHQSYLEPHACLANWDAAGNVTIWNTTQSQFNVRDTIARLLRMPISKVRVLGTEIGGGFGAKFGLIVPIAVLLARKAKRPVKYVMSRQEELIGATPAPYTVIDVKLGAKKDGTMTALEGRVVMDTGAFPGAPMSIATILVGGSYKFPNLALQGYEVLTNKASVGAYRAPGAPNVAFGIEGAVDLLAKKLNLDPIEIRLHNAIEEGDKWPNGNQMPAIGVKEILLALKNHPLNKEPLAPNRGRGVALGGWPGGAGAASAIVKANNNGTFTVSHGAINLTGSTTSLAQIAAEELGVPMGLVEIVQGDTSEAPHAPAAGGSQILYTMGLAVQQAAQRVREQLLKLAAADLNVEVDSLMVDGGIVCSKNGAGRALSYAKIADKAMQGDGPVLSVGSARPGKAYPGYCATLAEVEVDPETGQTRVTRLISAQDVGFAINPLSVEGQIQGGAVQGLGMAIYEEIVYNREGRVANPGLLDYKLPTCADVPWVEAIIVEVPNPIGPFGARIVGEPGIVPPGAAIGNAISNA